MMKRLVKMLRKIICKKQKYFIVPKKEEECDFEFSEFFIKKEK